MQAETLWAYWLLASSFFSLADAVDILDPHLIAKVSSYLGASCVHFWYKYHSKNELRFHQRIDFLHLSLSKYGLFFAAPNVAITKTSTLLTCFTGPALNVLIAKENPLFQDFQNFQEINNKLNTAVWLIILENESIPISKILENFNIGVDCQLIITHRLKQDWILNEAYYKQAQLSLTVSKIGMVGPKIIRMDERSFLVRRRDFHGLDFRVAVIKEPGFGDFKVVNGEIINFRGYLPELWKLVENFLNLRSEYKYNKSLGWGALNADGNWSGMVGHVARGHADLGLGGFLNIPIRKNVVDFPIPVLTTPFNVYIQDWLKGMDLMKWKNFFNPFGVYLWILIITSWPLFSIFFTIIQKLASRYQFDNSKFSIGDSFICVLGIYCQQGYPYTPIAISGRIFFFMMYLNAIVLIASFSASLISSLAVTIRIWPFHNLEELLKDGTYSFSVLKDSAEYSLFKESNDPLSQWITKNYLEPNEDSLPTDSLSAFQEVCEKRKMSFMTYVQSTLAIWDQLACPVVALPKSFGKLYLGPIVPKNSPYTQFINYGLLRTYSAGIMTRIRSHAWKHISNIKEETFNSVTLVDIFPIFLILSLGFLLAIILLIFENLFKKIKDRKVNANQLSSSIKTKQK